MEPAECLSETKGPMAQIRLRMGPLALVGTGLPAGPLTGGQGHLPPPATSAPTGLKNESWSSIPTSSWHDYARNRIHANDYYVFPAHRAFWR